MKTGEGTRRGPGRPQGSSLLYDDRLVKPVYSRGGACLSLVGFSSGGLLRATSGDLGLRLLGTRRRRRPRFGNKATQDEAVAPDQSGHNGQEAARKTTDHART